MRLKSNRFFVRTFSYVALIVAITIIALSSILFFRFEDLVLRKVHAYIYDDLTAVDESIETMRMNTKSLSMQIFYDLHVSRLLLFQSPSFEDVNLALNQLVFYNLIPQFVE